MEGLTPVRPLFFFQNLLFCGLLLFQTSLYLTKTHDEILRNLMTYYDFLRIIMILYDLL